MKKRFNPITDKSAEIIEYLMASPDMPADEGLLFKIRLSIEEAVENVVRYAYEGGIGSNCGAAFTPPAVKKTLNGTTGDLPKHSQHSKTPSPTGSSTNYSTKPLVKTTTHKPVSLPAYN